MTRRGHVPPGNPSTQPHLPSNGPHSHRGEGRIGSLLYSLSLVWLLAMACLNFAMLVLRGQVER